jgi:Recombinational DNA repair ATPase (RecF pathway)
MLTKLVIRNFKRLHDVAIELGGAVVFVGPNNSGKTSALQAISLWDVGMRSWNAKREGKSSPEKRPGVTINRRDLISTPVPTANDLWTKKHVRCGKVELGEKGTQNIRMDIQLSGIENDRTWECGFEFDFSNEETLVCRPLRLSGHENTPINATKFSSIPEDATKTRIAFLPPMSGIASEEPLLQSGRINVLLGQGQTAQVLRNLCYQILENDRHNHRNDWEQIANKIEVLFGARLSEPVFIKERGEIELQFIENTIDLDISASGRGLQQTLLLLAHMYVNPNTVLLLDEPDAHLEILRQREIFTAICEIAQQQGSQIIAASHSEVILNEAAGKGTVIAFCGKPHRLNDRGSHLLKALNSIGWDQYYQAEQTGWVLYLEGPSDLEILRAFAQTLQHTQAISILSRPFVHYIGTNHPPVCRDHFNGLREAKKDLIGIAIFDRIDRELSSNDEGLNEKMWKRREIESYFCIQEVLISYARHGLKENDLFDNIEAQRRVEAMEESIKEVEAALKTLDKGVPWSPDVKVSDDFLDPLFRNYFAKIGLYSLMRNKADYHILAHLLPAEQIDPEITEKLDAIVATAKKAHPCGE